MNSPRNKLTKGGVLLVAGDRSLHETILAALEAEQYEVFLAANGQQAAELMDTAPIEIVVFDSDARREDGRRLLATLTASKRRCRVVFIVRSLESLALAETGGADASILWPLDRAQCVAAVNSLQAELRSEAFRERLL